MWIPKNRRSGTLRMSIPPAPSARWTWTASTETAALLLSLFWLLSANRPFLSAALKGREWDDPGGSADLGHRVCQPLHGPVRRLPRPVHAAQRAAH
jgi:hypothetical protein